MKGRFPSGRTSPPESKSAALHQARAPWRSSCTLSPGTNLDSPRLRLGRRLLHHGEAGVSRAGVWTSARRLYEEGLVVNSVGGVGVRVLSWVDVWERRSSLYCLLGGRTRRHWRPASGAQFQKGRQAARRRVAPPEAGVGAKG